MSSRRQSLRLLNKKSSQGATHSHASDPRALGSDSPQSNVPPSPTLSLPNDLSHTGDRATRTYEKNTILQAPNTETPDLDIIDLLSAASTRSHLPSDTLAPHAKWAHLTLPSLFSPIHSPCLLGPPFSRIYPSRSDAYPVFLH